MRKTISFVLGAAAVFCVYALLSSYGNVVIHRGLNAAMINKFESSFITALSPLPQFKNYQIYLKSNIEYEGQTIVKPGYFDVSEVKRKYTAFKWIQEGGFTADEPEIFASFRHFYDPTAREGERYLKDHLDYLDSKGIVNQPKIDHINWALDHPAHEYNWKNGKTAFISALNSPDIDFKKNEMAFAFRALGETLHMIADMGCPAHVRDDAHASKSIAGYKLGSPDAYEEYSENFDLSTFDLSKVDPVLKEQFRKAGTVKEIATTLAKYTNSNFFTGQTIYGRDKDAELVLPIIRPENPYPAPLLSDCTYDFSTIGYYKTISGQEVLMCRDHYYSRFFKGYPYIDRACAESQAKVLIPQIVEAGANVIKLFIPQLKITITEYNAKEKFIKGKVKHIVSDEYDREIQYSGDIDIYDVKSRKRLTTVECKNGEFDEKIRLWDFSRVDWKKGIYAEIKLGSIAILSEPYLEIERGEAKDIDIEIFLDKATFQQKYGDGTIENSNSYSLNISPRFQGGTFQQIGNTITYLYDKTSKYDKYTGVPQEDYDHIEIELTFDPSSKSVSFRANQEFKETIFWSSETEVEFWMKENASYNDIPLVSSGSNWAVYEITGKKVQDINVTAYREDHELTDYVGNLLNKECGSNAKITVTVYYNEEYDE